MKASLNTRGAASRVTQVKGIGVNERHARVRKTFFSGVNHNKLLRLGN